MVSDRTGTPMRYEYDEKNRIGDHICYCSDLRRMMAHYPDWAITIPLATIFDEIVEAWQRRVG